LTSGYAVLHGLDHFDGQGVVEIAATGINTFLASSNTCLAQCYTAFVLHHAILAVVPAGFALLYADLTSFPDFFDRKYLVHRFSPF